MQYALFLLIYLHVCALNDMCVKSSIPFLIVFQKGFFNFFLFSWSVVKLGSYKLWVLLNYFKLKETILYSKLSIASVGKFFFQVPFLSTPSSSLARHQVMKRKIKQWNLLANGLASFVWKAYTVYLQPIINKTYQTIAQTQNWSVLGQPYIRRRKSITFSFTCTFIFLN